MYSSCVSGSQFDLIPLKHKNGELNVEIIDRFKTL